MKNYMLHLRRLRRELNEYLWFMVDVEEFTITEAERFVRSQWEYEIIRLDRKGVCGVLLERAEWWL